MARNRRIPPDLQVPIYRYDERRAQNAWAAYQAMRAAETPELRCNPAWTVLMLDALENFTLAYEVPG